MPYHHEDGQISNFPPGVTHVNCRICDKPVDVREDSTEWDERFPPAHRLCTNSEIGSSFQQPLWVIEMHDIWKALARQIVKSPEFWSDVMGTVRESATMHDPRCGDGDEFVSHRIRRAYAVRLWMRVIAAADGVPLSYRDSFIVNPPHSGHTKRQARLAELRRTGHYPKKPKRGRVSNNGR